MFSVKNIIFDISRCETLFYLRWRLKHYYNAIAWHMMTGRKEMEILIQIRRKEFLFENWLIIGGSLIREEERRDTRLHIYRWYFSNFQGPSCQLAYILDICILI